MARRAADLAGQHQAVAAIGLGLEQGAVDALEKGFAAVVTCCLEGADTEDLVKPGYVARHFIAVPYEEKMRTIAWVRAMIQTGPLRNYVPASWMNLMDADRTGWQPLALERIDAIVQSFNTLRAIEGYYLRNAAISLSEGIVRASYNCDGTYFVRADYFPEFVRINTP